MNREGDLRYVDRDVTPGASYEYRLESEAHGVLDLVNVTVPVRGPLALERVDPNPTSDGRAQVVFTLPRAGDARLDVFDAQGRRLGGRFTSYAAGTNRVALDAIVRPSKAGLYFVRLEQDGITAWRRFALAP
jgi:hypothetical protein